MNSTASRRLSSITALSLLSLLAIAIGAQAALAVTPSSTPAAGTQGRGGIDPASVTLVATTSPAAGTEGRGGIAAAPSTALAGTTPAAGTDGRGGVVSLSGPATLAGETTVATNGFSLRARGGVPRPVAGVFATPSTSSATTGFGVVVAVGIAVGVLLVGLAAWASSRRGRRQTATSRAAYCAQHPEDAMCMSA